MNLREKERDEHWRVSSNQSRWAEIRITTNTVLGSEGGREGEVNNSDVGSPTRDGTSQATSCFCKLPSRQAAQRAEITMARWLTDPHFRYKRNHAQHGRDLANDLSVKFSTCLCSSPGRQPHCHSVQCHPPPTLNIIYWWVLSPLEQCQTQKSGIIMCRHPGTSRWKMSKFCQFGPLCTTICLIFDWVILFACVGWNGLASHTGLWSYGAYTQELHNILCAYILSVICCSVYTSLVLKISCVMYNRWLPWLLGKLTPLVSSLLFGEG